MVCSHLAALETELIESGASVTSRGQAWSLNCREWVYFDIALDVAALQARFAFGPTVEVHENLDPRSGRERGFVCSSCHDAVMGIVRQDGGFKWSSLFRKVALAGYRGKPHSRLVLSSDENRALSR